MWMLQVIQSASDIGGLLNIVTHLFFDIRFVARIKKEFVENEISEKDALYENI